jgi:hypothetical protein
LLLSSRLHAPEAVAIPAPVRFNEIWLQVGWGVFNPAIFGIQSADEEEEAIYAHPLYLFVLTCCGGEAALYMTFEMQFISATSVP